ncbi:MAG TPA: hypothetical protein VGO96_09380 [Pyrinomonadaceae bacterium]|jgi:hypothetical protein|nr:hypothetical protein [Pyrinomonadaceae bacterium]
MVSKLTMPVLAVCLAALVVCGAQAKVRARKTVRLNQNFVLRVGQEVLVAEQGLSVKFVSVPEDSRCPTGVNCIWAGNVRVQLQVTKAKSKPVKVELSLNPRDFPDGEAADCGNYKIKLVKVDPYPVADQQLKPGDYAATLSITKK